VARQVAGLLLLSRGMTASRVSRRAEFSGTSDKPARVPIHPDRSGEQPARTRSRRAAGRPRSDGHL